MDPFAQRHQLQLRPLLPAAEALLRQHHAPPRLIAHHILVHDVAAQILDAFHQHGFTDSLDDQAVLFGAATHDIGKVSHPMELTGPGHQHEYAGKLLLLHAGVPTRLARFAETHGTWDMSPDITIDDLLVALADTCWKGKRNTDLEQRIITEQARHKDRDQWAIFLTIDDIVESISVAADPRLIWQAQFTATL